MAESLVSDNTWLLRPGMMGAFKIALARLLKAGSGLADCSDQ